MTTSFYWIGADEGGDGDEGHIGTRAAAGSCSSFSWSENPPGVILECMRANSDKLLVVDEHDNKFTGHDFVKVILDCAVWFTDYVGKR